MTIAELLEDHTPEVAALARKLIDHVEGAAAWSELRVYGGWHGVGFHHPDLGYVVGIFPRADSVRVLFEHGHLLGEAPLLEGTGQTRYVDFTEWGGIPVATLEDVLARALDE